MAVQCSLCGRDYDITLFEYGRTIRCTCGARVGLEHRRSIEPRSEEPRFIADAMLEKLARWLRLLGFDCAFQRGIADDALVRWALREGRTILTRDRRLADEWRVEGIVEVPAGTTHEQLAAVVARLDLAPKIRPYTRCSRCNTEVVEVPAAEVEGRVPERVRASYERFLRCPRCDAIHWAGAHTTRIDRVVQALRSL